MERIASTTTSVVGPPLGRQRVAIVAVLLLVAATGWAIFLVQASDDSMGGMASMEEPAAMDSRAGMDHAGDMDSAPAGAVAAGPVPDLSMGGSAPLFLASWVAMMAAMMLPAAAPMVLLYARTQRARPLPTGLFSGSYLALWAAFGAAAFLVAVGVEQLAEGSAFAARNWARMAGGLIVLAGLYQLTPLKDVCLRQCRSPLSFVLHAWRPGLGGAVRMGLHHGLYCAGCCWLLFLVLVPIGVMNVVAMLLVALVVFAEKILPWERVTTGLTAAVLLAYGIAVIARPGLLPTA